MEEIKILGKVLEILKGVYDSCILGCRIGR